MNIANKNIIQALQLQEKGKIDEAAKLFKQVLTSSPNDVAALFSLALITLRNYKDHTEALRILDHGVKAAPLYAPMQALRGDALQAAGQLEAALLSYDEALKIDANFVTALINSGVLLQQLSRHHESLEKFNRVLAIDPNNTIALANCGVLLTEFKQSEKAIALFETLLQVNPDYDYALGLLCFEKMHICDWNGLDTLIPTILDGVRAGKRACKTLALMAISDSASDLLAATRTFSQHMFPKAPHALWNGERYPHRKIRIAYVSADLREHPVGHLMAGVLEKHDKSRFETIAISLGIDDKSRIRDRMLKAFDRFIDAQKMGARQIAQLMRDLEVDIAVNLSGYTSGSRTEVFAYRPAPVQINYLGYPGTMGLEYMDYILADSHVIQEGQREFYSEKVATLPNSYLPTDGNLKVSDRTPTRAECGLPEMGFIFCSFNHDYKISPQVFAIWMRLLEKVEGSVLWLMKLNEPAQKNLHKAAEEHGIDPKRLIFATRVPMVEDHLARYRLADIFLDTYPYNAHTTAADALFSGLPVVTYMGNILQGRVAGSLLHTLGLPKLVTHSLADYEALALKLATDPGLLAEMKKKVEQQRRVSPLFDTELFCRHVESAFITMWERFQAGLAADHFAVTQAHCPSTLHDQIVDMIHIQPAETPVHTPFPEYAKTQDQAYWPVRIKGDVIICVQPTVKQMSSYVLLEQEDWFEDEMDFVRAYITPGMNALDIGANHGVYAMSIAKILETGHVWAFEPTVTPGKMLARSIELNGFSSKISWVHAGLSDHQGSAEISTSLNSELNSLYGNSGFKETIRLNMLDEYLQANNINVPIEFVKLDAEGEEIKVLRGGNDFFIRQSPLIMFELKHGSEVNHGLIETIEQLGYGIYRLLPDLNILVEYDPSYQDDVLNLFACKPEHAIALADRGLLARNQDIDSTSLADPGNKIDLLQKLGEFPYAKACEAEWLALISEVPGDYINALSACLKAHNLTLPAANRVALLQSASDAIDRVLQTPGGAHYSAWLLKIHLLHLQNRRVGSVNLCQQLAHTFSNATTPSWPFIPPRKMFFSRSPQSPVGSWLREILLEFIECRKSFSSYFSADPLTGLQAMLNGKDHGLAIERRFALGAKKAGKTVLPPPSFPLLDPEYSPNAPIWHQILGTGFSSIILDNQSPVHIVDVGASTFGRMTEPYATLMQLGLAKVTGFEPNQEECQRLNDLYANTKKYHYYPNFVGKGGPATFYETNWFMTGSLYKPNEQVLNVYEQLDNVVQLQAEHPVDTVSLAQLEDLDSIDMIKIDVQGGELDVFKAAAEKLDDVMLIWTEVEFIPLYENQPLFAEVDQYLRERGFIFHAFEGIATRGYKPYSSLTANINGMRQAIWSDAIFVRDPSQWEKLSTLKLKKLAAILDAVTKSYDLCFLALGLIDKREGSDLSSQYLALRNLA
jgi:protein O-GlcNAc transferase